jgi:hypothetical protein
MGRDQKVPENPFIGDDNDQIIPAWLDRCLFIQSNISLVHFALFSHKRRLYAFFSKTCYNSTGMILKEVFSKDYGSN